MSSKEEWLQLIDQEEGESLALSLIDDILTRSQHILFEKHIDVQVPPYAVKVTHDTLVNIINFKYFRRDPGNNDPNLWIPDEEPSPVVPDSWARSAIPLKTLMTIRSRHVCGSDTKINTSVKSDPNKLAVSSKGSQVNSTESINKESARRPSGETTSIESVKKNVSSPQKRPSVPKVNQHPVAAPASEPPSSGRRRPSRISRPSIARHSFAGDGKNQDSPGGDPTNSGVNHHGSNEGYNSGRVLMSTEQAIQEENRRMMLRIHNMQKEGSKVEYSFDQDGRVILVTKVATPKLISQGVKTRVVQDKDILLGETTLDNHVEHGATSKMKATAETETQGKSGKSRVMFRGMESGAGEGESATANRVTPLKGQTRSPAATTGSKSNDSRKGSNPRKPAQNKPIDPVTTSVGLHRGSIPFNRHPPVPQIFDLTPHHGHGHRQASLPHSNTSAPMSHHHHHHHPENKAVPSDSLGLLPGTSLLPPLHHDGFIHDPALDVPPLTEAIKLAPGVTLREGDAVRKGPAPANKGQKQQPETNSDSHHHGSTR